ncbi:sodium:alanine symporter family protein [Evtepia sp.]|uniref:alanine/glycine:cation symporter family protein n=1 Tax=Evtepia sp. TaxID=2773933 RepID=UPI002A8402D6|nr:sodium:alanine symporter family protein [Evtepia sp.]MDY3992514.1 sodium:alanine symporter family protein [Evtepia sp.]MDY4430108.1 sodium:alanine symporter family protein [Evtepia sp.]
MELIASINGAINGVVWGPPMLILLVGAGILLTIRTAGVQFRKFGYALKNTIGKVFKKSEAKEGEVTPFQAVTTALAATVGTGNIAGITAAVTLGGPGSIFWLWITALFGMCTKYSEVLLAVKYRERNKYGDWVGGPMYYIKNGLGKGWKWLGAIFCIFGALAAFGIGNAVQVGNITSSINTVITAFNPEFSAQSTVNLVLGIILAVLAAIVLFGGIKRLGSVTEKLVPVMAVVYIVACVCVIVYNAEYLPAIFRDIFKGAFTPAGATGGAVGSMMLCITWGVKRGVFSNEAGLGSAPMAHAATSEKDPVRQGLYGIFEVFMDTIVICTLSGVTVLCGFYAGGLNGMMEYGVKGDTSLNAAALGTVFGMKGGSIIIALCLALFAFSTVLSWSLYGTRCCEFLFGPKAIRPYQVIFVIIIIVGATMDLTLAWDIADTLNGLMAIPNLIALVGLSGVVVKETKDYFNNRHKEFD